MWENIVFPLINKLKPNYIVEVGAERGTNTMSMLEYCAENDGNLTCIDPFPLFDVDSLKEKYGEKFEMIEDLSLNVLDSIKDYDLILLDGDHNWYTIYNELKSIESNFNQDTFPFIIFHDISWPYARRDIYYNPNDIPEEFLNKYEKKGIYPGESKLREVGGLNSSIYNATEENTPKNGVLTGIEDFIKESDLNLTFKTLNAFHGLGLMYTPNSETDKIIHDIIWTSDITVVMDNYYLKKTIDLGDNINRLKKEISQKNQELNNLKSENKELKAENKKLNKKQKEIFSSNSWKITKPLRFRNKLFKKN